MGKRSNFERFPRDKYRSNQTVSDPLLPFLMPSTVFIEPCAGDGALVALLEAQGHVCAQAFDIEPDAPGIAQRDVFEPVDENEAADCYITNPPWDRKILHPLILHLSDHRPTWLLFDAAWAFTRQAAPFLPRLRRIVSVGRVKWIPGSDFASLDDCAWYLFGKPTGQPTIFHGQRPKVKR